MKIMREGSFISRMNSIAKSNLHPASDSARKTNKKNFDAILIHSREIPDEATFAKEISKKLSKEVRAEQDTQKIEELKGQVQSGSYDIMLDEIAKRMLLA